MKAAYLRGCVWTGKCSRMNSCISSVRLMLNQSSFRYSAAAACSTSTRRLTRSNVLELPHGGRVQSPSEDGANSRSRASRRGSGNPRRSDLVVRWAVAAGASLCASVEPSVSVKLLRGASACPSPVALHRLAIPRQPVLCHPASAQFAAGHVRPQPPG